MPTMNESEVEYGFQYEMIRLFRIFMFVPCISDD